MRGRRSGAAGGGMVGYDGRRRGWRERRLGGERPAAAQGEWRRGGGGESITLADVKVGDTWWGRGALKNGVFVPTELAGDGSGGEGGGGGAASGWGGWVRRRLTVPAALRSSAA